MEHGPRMAGYEQRCIACPCPDNLHCSGLDVRRFCELIDPTCPQFNLAYRGVIVQESRSAAAATGLPAAPNSYPAFPRSTRRGDSATAILGDCCGGGALAGIFADTGFDDSSSPAPAANRTENANDQLSEANAIGRQTRDPG
jgi:hypothetical protein